MRRHGRGMSLVVVLLLLAGVMLLAVSGLGGAIAAIALADFDERSSLAFEAAEAGVTRTLRGGNALSPPAGAWPATARAVTVWTVLRQDPPASPPAWPSGFSLGTADGFVLHHGTVLAEGSAGRGTLTRIEQGFTVVAPAREFPR
jgi:Tfp pilus assembly protein PilX